VVFKAGTSVTLQSGFSAVLGSDFHALIAPCSLSPLIQEMPEPSQLNNNAHFLEHQRFSKETQLQVHPNPLQNNASIRFFMPTQSSVQIFITDFNGQLLAKQSANGAIGWNSTNLDASQLPIGIYYVTLQTKQGSFTEKITVVR